MSNTMKKILALLLAAVMMLSLVACGGGGEEAKPQGTEGNQTSDTTEATEPFDAMAKYEKPITLTVGNWVNDMDTVDEFGNTYDDNAFWDYVAGELNVNFEWELVNANSLDYEQATDLALAAGEMPDAFVVLGYNRLREFVDEGVLLDLTELIETYGSDTLKSYYAEFGNAWDISTFDGSIMAIPCLGSPNAMKIHIRQDWLDKLGLEVDTDGNGMITLEELEMVAREFAAKDPGESGNPAGFVSQASASNFYTGSHFISQYFGALEFQWIKNEDGTVTNGILDPDMKDSLAWLAELFADGVVDDEFGITTGNGAKMTAGRVGIVVPSNVNGMVWHYNNAYAGQPEMQMTTYFLDDGTGHCTYTTEHPQANRFLAISKDCEHPEAVIKILNLVFDLMTKTADYDYIDANYPEFKDVNYSCKDSEFNPIGILWTTRPSDENPADIYRAIISGEREPDETNTWEMNLKAYLDGDRSPEVRMSYDYALSVIHDDEVLNSGNVTINFYQIPPVVDAMAEYQSALNDLACEAMVKIVTGEEPVEYWDTFVEEWYERGGQEIIDQLEEAWN